MSDQFASSIIHSFNPINANLGFFAKDNIEFIENKIQEVLGYEYKQRVIVDRDSIIRVMSRILKQRFESVPKMNERVVMTITNEFRVHQTNVNKTLKFEENYKESQKLISTKNHTALADLNGIKTRNRLRKQTVGGTLHFHSANMEAIRNYSRPEVNHMHYKHF
jgi:hypothetical protein